ncbi:Ig-like domain-containing protein [Anabaena catenula]|uniref:Ig-like domain-containing protein n=1 Tax=Anabaena catenula FACHB-362 TaxID=2692877 RepID=A0ABR8J354_9NOST|nr:Ig-like domain-containing protein [Anabaena catenula]MBD2692798.1 Ig-like domain-containing protein [Anabaena catenula FACHB-362]
MTPKVAPTVAQSSSTDANGIGWFIDPTPNGRVELGTAAHGSNIINPDSILTYTPNNNFVGTDTFTYIVLDNNAISNEATVRDFQLKNIPICSTDVGV